MADWLLEELYARRSGSFLTTMTIREASNGNFKLPSSL
jgi:hypothetical protein